MNTIKLCGYIGSILGTLTFLSFIHQSWLNLNGIKGSIILAALVAINCVFWAIYAFKTKQYVLFIPNVIGAICATICVITWLI